MSKWQTVRPGDLQNLVSHIINSERQPTVRTGSLGFELKDLYHTDIRSQCTLSIVKYFLMCLHQTINFHVALFIEPVINTYNSQPLFWL